MFVSIEHNEGKFPSFNVNIHSAEGSDPFCVIKGCRIVNGSKGEFVSGPATKNQQSGKYWNHTYFGEKFAAHVLKLAQADKPKPAKPTRPAAPEQEQDKDIPW